MSALPSPASFPTSAERSRAASLVTSFGSCGSIYDPNILPRPDIPYPTPRKPLQRILVPLRKAYTWKFQLHVASSSKLVLCRYPRLRDSTSHTTAAMTAITIMAMITLPIVSLCTIVSTLAHHTSGWETQDRAHRQRREARAVASYFLLSVTLRGIVKCCGSTLDHAATFCSSLSASLPSTNAPFSNFAPALTNATR